MKYWVAHLKNGQRLEFGRQSGYIELYQDGLCYAFMTCKNGNIVGIVPNESLLWAELFEENESLPLANRAENIRSDICD